ncbi:uncharacterized protein LOC103281112 [Anolis carolinensis]|uniref:uncharacterized protein LOC103281112 n=1 Tax=Anolis carolinensis TaxID=28377 RepID=UPI000462CC8D|nr:PREDICTED: uncharacterized protein LOC103281112 [Anolis carolinensis]|eukprot:XP_008120162.1 PREDICTED: uncharacterized protein LOC103281112 [Anolis carolinensis]
MAFVQDDKYNRFIRKHSAAGLQELVSLAEILFLPRPHSEEICNKTRDRINNASYHFSEAERQVESHLSQVDSQSEAMIAVKKQMQDDLQEKKGSLADLRAQMVAIKEVQKKSQAMLESAEVHLENAKKQYEETKKEEEEDIFYQTLLSVGVGPVIALLTLPSLEAARKSAENHIAEAQEAVVQSIAEVDGYRNEVAQLSQKEQEIQAGINTAEEKISQIQAEHDEILAFHNTVTTQQTWIRKFLSLLDLLGGRIDASAVMYSPDCTPDSLVGILEEIAGMVAGQDAKSFCAYEEIQALVLQINKTMQSLKATAGGNETIA